MRMLAGISASCAPYGAYARKTGQDPPRKVFPAERHHRIDRESLESIPLKVCEEPILVSALGLLWGEHAAKAFLNPGGGSVPIKRDLAPL